MGLAVGSSTGRQGGIEESIEILRSFFVPVGVLRGSLFQRLLWPFRQRLIVCTVALLGLCGLCRFGQHHDRNMPWRRVLS